MRKKIPLIGGIINLIESLKGDIGIVENTDVATHSIASGSYVIWKNGLYTASSAISVDDALSLSNLTAVSGGAANELNNNNNITTGTAELSSISANSNLEATVSFGKTFANPPVVFTQVVGPYQGNEIAMGGLVSVSETEFKIRIRNTAASAFAPKLNWLAIGK